MISLEDFIKKYNGKIVSYPEGQYIGECLSLVKLYIKECFGISPPPSGTNSAYGYWSNFPSPLGTVFNKIKNDPGVVPVPGDICIWSPTASNSFGHIDICMWADKTSSKFLGFDANWNGKEAQETSHYYTNVVGWLHSREVTTSDNIDRLKADLAEQQKQVSNLQTQVNGLLENIKVWEKKYEECNTQRIEACASADGFRKQLNDFIATLANILGTRQETAEIIASVQTSIGFEDKAIKLTRRLELEEREHQEAITTLETKIKTLEGNLATLKADLQAVKDETIPPAVKKSILELLVELWRSIWQK